MKKLLTITAVGVLLTAPATAVQKCVNLNNSNTTCTYNGISNSKADWSAICTTNGASVPIKGIGVCASNAGTAVGDTADELTFDSSSTTNNNTHCWCRMISPAVSKWVYNNQQPYDYVCTGQCAYYCSYGLTYSTTHTLRSALLSNLSD